MGKRYENTFARDEALMATKLDYRCDPEAALALWLYAGRSAKQLSAYPKTMW
jgi:hypothetical protein